MLQLAAGWSTSSWLLGPCSLNRQGDTAPQTPSRAARSALGDRLNCPQSTPSMGDLSIPGGQVILLASVPVDVARATHEGLPAGTK